MKVYNLMTQRTPEWFDVRMGKVTGTSLQKIVGTPAAKKKAFYELVAERLSLPDYDEENPMARGARLEDEARVKYEELSGYVVATAGFCHREDNKYIGFSPDGLICLEGRYVGHLEIKCLGGGNHIQALMEKEIPKEYLPQIIQGWIVNDDCEWTDFFMYDPRNAHHPVVQFRLNREDYLDEIAEHKREEEDTINLVNEAVKNLIK